MTKRTWFERFVASLFTAVLIGGGLVVLDVAPASAVPPAPPGALDVSFAGDGTATGGTPFGNFGPSEVMAIDSQGRVLVQGTSGTQSHLARLLPDGSPDPTFEGFPTGISMDLSFQNQPNAPRGLAVLSTGELVRVAEYQEGGDVGTDNTRLRVQKLHPDGGPHSSVVLGDGGLGMAGAVSGYVAALADGKFLVSGSNPTPGLDFGRFFVVRYNNNLSVDATFDGDGVAFVDFGTRAVNQALALQPDGKILLGGHIGHGGGHQSGVARLLATGAPDATFGTNGQLTWDGSGSGANDWADGIAVRGDGKIAVSGYSEGARSGHVTVLHPDGSFDTGFGANGVFGFTNRRIADVAWDPEGRILVPVGHYGGGTETGVARLLLQPLAPLDTSFGAGGVSTIPGCGGAYAVAVASFSRPVVTGSCGGQLLAARFVGRAPLWTDLSYTIEPTAPAGRASIPLDAATLQALAAVPAELQSSPLRGTPLRGTPLRGTPLRGTPLRGTPLRGTPLRGTELLATPLRGTALQTPLSSIPLIQDGPNDPTWSDVLAPTVYRDIPLTNVTLEQVLALEPGNPDFLAAVTLADIPLRGTPLRGTSISALLLGQVPLELLPAPAGGWCAFLAGTAGPDCVATATSPAAVVLSEWTLLDLELVGVDLAPYFAQPIPLAGVDLRGSVLGNIRVADLDLPKTPLGALPVAALPDGLVLCTTCGATLGAVQAAGLQHLDDEIPLADLLRHVMPQVLPQISLGELIAGLVRGEDLPVEYLPLAPLLERAPIASDVNAAQAQFIAAVTYDLQCREESGHPEPDLRIALPAGTRFVPGSQLLAVAVEESHDAADLPATAIAGGISFALPEVCDEVAETKPMHLSFRIDPPVTLGPLGASSVTLEGDGASESVAATAEDGATPATTLDREVPDDDVETSATRIGTDTVYTGHLGAAGDIDLFEVPAPPAGSTLAVSLSHLPADYDLSIYGEGDELPSTPLRGTPLRGTPLRGTPVGDALDDPAASLEDAPAEGLADIPLRGTPLRGTSLNRGTTVESVSVLAKGADQTTGFLVQVSGFDGAHSDQPYVLRARVIPGPAPAPCPPRTFPHAGVAGTWPASVPAGTETIILVNQQRLGARYGATEAAAAVQRLRDLAGRDDVKGVVLPVESAPGGDVAAAYAAWDLDACSVAAANAVVNQINLAVDGLRPHLAGLRHVVLVGSDEIVPQARIPDLTRLSNQSDYTDSVRFDGKDNAISRAFLESNILSDEPYGDFDPQPWLAGKLYVADVGLGRLVETPAEITAAVDRFFGAGGVLAPSTSYVTGYDFLKDGADAVAAPLGQLTPQAVSTRIDEQWTAADAAAGIAAVAATAPNGQGGGVASVNAHYDHYQALPALPFNAHSTADDQLLTTSHLPSTLLNTILFTMGCEAGLNVADVLVNAAGPDAAAARDWAQTVTSRGGLFAGNTGYGYGDTEAVAYSERLMANFAEFLAGRQATAGQALMFAKQRYQAELGVAGVYDAKAMEEATFYGLPMYRIGATGAVAPAAVPAFEPAAVVAPATPEAFDTAVTFDDVVGAHGTHYEVIGEEPQVTHYRPIQPRLDTEYAVPADGSRIHGVVIEDLDSRDIGGVDAAYGTPTVDLGAHEPEAVTRSSVFPAAIQAVSSKSTPAGRKDVVVLMPGQFFADDAGDGKGTQRLFDRIRGQVLRSTSTDFDAPRIRTVEATEAGSVARIDVTSDAADIVRGVALYRLGTDTTVEVDWHKVELDAMAGGRTAVVPLPAGMQVVDLLVQLVDGAGNVGVSSNKGPGYRSELAPPTAVDVIVDPPLGDGYVAQGPTFSAPAGAQLTIEVDGGAPQPLTGLVQVAGDGPHRVVVRNAGTGASQLLSFVVDTGAPVATITAPVDGATYAVGFVPGASSSCTDGTGSGIATCVRSGYGTAVGEHTFQVTATDRAGNAHVASVTYTVTDPGYSFGTFSSPVEEAPMVNRTRAGAAVPVKFQVFDGGGTLVRDPSLVDIRSVVDCSSTLAADTIEQTVAAATSSLRFDEASQRFIYVWKTDKTWVGCRKLIISVGGVEKVAYFHLSK